MCLQLKKGAKPKIAKEDIVVWKHIIKEGEDKFITSFQFTPVRFNELIISTINKIDNNVYEALHSFVKFKDAKERAKHYNEVLVKCIIPRNSEYYEGTFSIGFKDYASYASDKLIYLEIIP